jgi:hypothetical protein
MIPKGENTCELSRRTDRRPKSKDQKTKRPKNIVPHPEFRPRAKGEREKVAVPHPGPAGQSPKAIQLDWPVYGGLRDSGRRRPLGRGRDASSNTNKPPFPPSCRPLSTPKSIGLCFWLWLCLWLWLSGLPLPCTTYRAMRERRRHRRSRGRITTYWTQELPLQLPWAWSTVVPSPGRPIQPVHDLTGVPL